MRRSAVGSRCGRRAMLLSGCGYNTMQSQDEQVKSAWSEVINQYQRRADLIPNLVNTVKGYAAQEQTGAAGRDRGARQGRLHPGDARAGQRSARRSPSSRRRRASCPAPCRDLMVVTENYPQLKSDQNFRDLQAQLEGTENRITVARNRYIQAVQNYNVTVRSLPRQFDRHDVRLQAEAEFHGRERGGDLQAADAWISRDRRPPPPADRRTGALVAAPARGGVVAVPRRAAGARAMSPCRRSRRASSISPAPCPAGR